jgi:hypothetical protein
MSSADYISIKNMFYIRLSYRDFSSINSCDLDKRSWVSVSLAGDLVAVAFDDVIVLISNSSSGAVNFNAYFVSVVYKSNKNS